MRVLMFGWEFPPHIAGGLGTACYGMTKGLAHCGVDVLFVMPSASGDEDQSSVRIINASDVAVYDTYPDIDEFLGKVQFLRVGSNLHPYIDPVDFSELVEEEQRNQKEEFKFYFRQKYKFSGKYGKNLMEEVSRYAMVAGAIAAEQQFDVIHAHDWLTYYAGIAAKRVSGKPLVIHVHATSFDRGSADNIDTRVFEIEKRGMEEADKVITVSDLTRNIVISKYGIPAHKVFTLHNAVVPTDKKVEREKNVDEKIVTFLGRVTFQKGPDYFVETAKRVLDKDPNVRFVLAGDGDMMQHVIERVAELGISDRFHFTGFLRGADIDKMFGMSDVYVMPSISEPFGISPLEAMRAKVPVVISKQSGVAEVLQHAIKVDFWDIDATADAIYGLLHYPALSKLFADKGEEEVNNLKWENVAKKLKVIYEKTLHYE